MKLKDLVIWQLAAYDKYHQEKLNLWIHLFAVPSFNLGLFGIIVSISLFSLSYLCLSILFSVIAVQAIGHKREALPPEAFTSGVNLFTRIVIEQLITFPWFVMSGGWYRTLRNHA